MPQLKRKWDETEDSDLDEPSFGKQILPVAQLPDDFDGEPSDGMQYLFTVRRDARHLPHIFRAENPYKISEDVDLPPSRDTLSHTHPSLPCEEWRSVLKKRFRNFCKNIDQPTIYVALIRTRPTNRMPDKKERDLWWDFLSGKPEQDWNPPKKSKKKNAKRCSQSGNGMRGWSAATNDNSFGELPGPSHASDGEVEQSLKLDPADSLPTPSGTPAPSDFAGRSGLIGDSEGEMEVQPEIILQSREPSTTLIKLIDERMALHLLMYFTYWINRHIQQPNITSYSLTDSHARWMFALLTRIDDHISADDMSLLRNLARACLEFFKFSDRERKTSLTINGGKTKFLMDERSCWMIVSIIVVIWNQRDLWTDAGDMLRSLDG